MFAIMLASAGTPPAPNPLIELMLPLVLMFGIFYFLVFRPQSQARKKHQEMIMAVRRGDTVVTSGGLVGKVVKASDGDEVQVEIAEGVQVNVVKATLSDVRSKTEPADKKDKK